MKRLIQSQIYDGFNYKDEYCEVYKNPTSQEISDVKKTNIYSSIRGMIQEDGTLYVWNGEIVHNKLLSLINNSIEDYMRFSYNDSDGWFFDVQYKFTSSGIEQLIIKNKNILSQVGNINNVISYSYTKDRINKSIQIEDMEKSNEVNNG